MKNTVAVIAELVVLIFNILIFVQLTIPKKDTLLTKLIMYIGAGIMLAVFVVCTGFLGMPEALSSFICITIPSATLFFSLSKYKDARFITTFCFLDTVTMITTFFARAIDLSFGLTAGIAAYVLLCIIAAVVYIKGRPYFGRYRELMENVRDGWGSMAISTVLIYILIVFSASYPQPLIERTEYIPTQLLLSVTIASFYIVFVLSLLQKKSLYDLNIRLTKEQEWHRIAYVDALTGMNNRMAYIEKINELERLDNKNMPIHAIMIDLDNFKRINDTLGHHVGDITLKRAAECINKLFGGEKYMNFRIGGDEFAVIAAGVDKNEVQYKINCIMNKEYTTEVGCTFSVGYSEVDENQRNRIENAFIRADSNMYIAKAEKKISTV